MHCCCFCRRCLAAAANHTHLAAVLLCHRSSAVVRVRLVVVQQSGEIFTHLPVSCVFLCVTEPPVVAHVCVRVSIGHDSVRSFRVGRRRRRRRGRPIPLASTRSSRADAGDAVPTDALRAPCAVNVSRALCAHVRAIGVVHHTLVFLFAVQFSQSAGGDRTDTVYFLDWSSVSRGAAQVLRKLVFVFLGDHCE